jgi:hypothetical protein
MPFFGIKQPCKVSIKNGCAGISSDAKEVAVGWEFEAFL